MLIIALGFTIITVLSVGLGWTVETCRKMEEGKRAQEMFDMADNIQNIATAARESTSKEVGVL